MNITAWHFLPDDGKLAHGDGRMVTVGETLTVPPPVSLCRHGLHGSRRALDALKYAEGALCCRVVLSGDIIEDTDKVVASERTVLVMGDVTVLLHEYACDVAEQALSRCEDVDPRSWRAIETKRAWLRGAASYDDLVAARAATRDAAWAAARDAAWAAAWAAAWDTAWKAANDDLETRLRAALGIEQP